MGNMREMQSNDRRILAIQSMVHLCEDFLSLSLALVDGKLFSMTLFNLYADHLELVCKKYTDTHEPFVLCNFTPLHRCLNKRYCLIGKKACQDSSFFCFRRANCHCGSQIPPYARLSCARFFHRPETRSKVWM